MQLSKREAPRRNETRDLVHPIRLALNKLPGVRVVRNNSGMLETKEGACVRYGLGEGSADLVGIVQCATQLGPDHFGRAFALEVKWPGQYPTRDQKRWLAEFRKLGGFACVVHSIEEAVAAVERCRRGESE